MTLQSNLKVRDSTSVIVHLNSDKFSGTESPHALTFLLRANLHLRLTPLLTAVHAQRLLSGHKQVIAVGIKTDVNDVVAISKSALDVNGLELLAHVLQSDR